MEQESWWRYVVSSLRGFHFLPAYMEVIKEKVEKHRCVDNIKVNLMAFVDVTWGYIMLSLRKYYADYSKSLHCKRRKNR